MNKTKDKKIEKWIDLSVLPRSKSGYSIDWTRSIGYTVSFMYGKHTGCLTILYKLSHNKYRVLISTSEESYEYTLSRSGISQCKLGGVFSRPIAITHPQLITYFIDINDAYKYQAYSTKTVTMRCPICGTVRNRSIYMLTSFGFACPACSDGVSYPNKFMFNILTQLKIDFKNEVTKATPGFEWIGGNYRYDFYFQLNGRKYFIEMDGKLHDGGFRVSYEDAHKIDLLKDNLAYQHGIEMIRIDCKYDKIQDRFEYIRKNIIDSKCGQVFDLNSINWCLANSFAADSNIKLAAKLWDSEDCCAIDVGTKLGVSRDTARGYLKIASNLGLCNYNEQEIEDRMLRRIYRNNKHKSKPIALYKDGDMINVFLGVVDLDKQSEALYGVHMDYRNIYAVCKGDRKHTYGYTMKYITREEYEQLAPQFNPTIQN